MPPPQRILIVRLSAIGDCVMASPVAQCLRESFPHAHIAWAVGEKSRAVVEGNPFIDEVLVWKSGGRGFYDLVRRVREARFDAVLELQGRPKSSLLMALSGAPRRLVSPRFGFFSRLVSTQRVEHPPGLIYPTLRYICWASALGAATSETPHLTVPIAAADRQAAQKLLDVADTDVADTAPDALLIGLNPGCSAPNRKWSASNFALTAQILAQHHPEASFVVCGGPQDRHDAQIIAEKLPAGRVVNAAGQLDLRGTAALLERCAVVVTNDTGPMHIAVAVGARVVGIFGPVAAARRLPAGGKHIGVQNNAPCRPPHRPKCSRGGECTCLQSVSPQQVADAVTRSLEEAHAEEAHAMAPEAALENRKGMPGETSGAL